MGLFFLWRGAENISAFGIFLQRLQKDPKDQNVRAKPKTLSRKLKRCQIDDRTGKTAILFELFLKFLKSLFEAFDVGPEAGNLPFQLFDPTRIGTTAGNTGYLGSRKGLDVDLA